VNSLHPFLKETFRARDMTVPYSENLFHVYKSGRMTVIGFDGKYIIDPLHSDSIREHLLAMIERCDCEILVVDLLEVGVVSSWILGILTAIQKTGVQVELYHPSKEMQDVLDVTHLSSYLHVRGAAT
jgi:anti-sigma B factor antagonist